MKQRFAVTGMTCSSCSAAVEKSAKKAEGVRAVEAENGEMKRRTIVSFVFLVPLMYIAMGHMFGFPLPEWIHGAPNAISFVLIQFLL